MPPAGAKLPATSCERSIVFLWGPRLLGCWAGEGERMKVLAAIVALWAALTAISFVPFFASVTPGLITPSPSRVPIQGDEVNTQADVSKVVTEGCHRIPFWVRAIANDPAETRLIILKGDSEIGEIDVRCD